MKVVALKIGFLKDLWNWFDTFLASGPELLSRLFFWVVGWCLVFPGVRDLTCWSCWTFLQRTMTRNRKLPVAAVARSVTVMLQVWPTMVPGTSFWCVVWLVFCWLLTVREVACWYIDILSRTDAGEGMLPVNTTLLRLLRLMRLLRLLRLLGWFHRVLFDRAKMEISPVVLRLLVCNTKNFTQPSHLLLMLN